MKITVHEGMYVAGRLVHPGDVLDVSPTHALDAIASGRASPHSRDELAHAAAESTRVAVQAEAQSRRFTNWR